MKYSTVEIEYLIELLKAAIKGCAPSPVPDQLDWQALFELAKKQQVFSIIAAIAENIAIPEQQAGQLKLYNQSELLHMLAMKSEQEQLEAQLQENGISFMLLKGSVLRSYYPKQKMRQMSDVDILYNSDKRQQLLQLMKSRGYTLFSSGENSDDFSKKPYYTFEFHRELFYKEHDFYMDFSNVWENAVVDESNFCKYHMSIEDLYLHTIAHMYKHYVLGGFGIRFLADVYLFLQKEADKLNYEYINARLAQMELTDFERLVRSLSLKTFEDNDYNQEEIAFLNNVMSFGIYGNTEVGVKMYYEEYLKNNAGKGTVFGYYCSKLFPSKAFMKKNYEILNAKPYLLPIYYIKRLFEKLFFDRKRILDNIKTLKNNKD